MAARFQESAFPNAQKRRADDNLESEQRLSKRLHLLNLEHNDKRYMPVRGNAPTSVPATKAQCDSMQLDDTKDKVYIHDLAAEIADLESDEETPLFLPDVEKKLSKIPLSVLTGKSPPVTSNQLVLYNVPSSISVPEEQDGVRRAIIESRARARERQAHEQRAAQEAVLGNGHPGTDIRHHVHNNAVANVEGMEVDDGAMEIE